MAKRLQLVLVGMVAKLFAAAPPMACLPELNLML